jgi:hypothetical protein
LILEDVLAIAPVAFLRERDATTRWLMGSAVP